MEKRLPNRNINIVESMDSPGQTLAQIEVREIRRSQRDDPGIGVWYRAVMDKHPPKKNELSNDPKHQTMSRNFKSFHMIRGVLYRKTQDNGKEINQLVLPFIYRNQVLQGLHNDVGHPGKERSCSLIRERFYWPGYMADVEKHVQRCSRCLRRKSTTAKAPLVPIYSSYPLERVCMDYLTVEPCQGNIENILVITDHYTKYSVAVPTKNQTAKTTAEALLNNFILHYGIPTMLHTDQGRNFESDLMKELCHLMDIQKTRTTIYHPMCNGQTERYNRTLLDMLGTLEPEKKRNWKKFIPTLVYAYNATKHESTGYTPFELMFGRKPKLPIDAVFQLDTDTEVITSDYVKDLKDRLKTSHELASAALKKAKLKQKTQFDKKAKASQVNVGDTVLVKILAYEGKHKIADKFEQGTYKVVEQTHPDIPVYKVRNEDGMEKTLHRNHLLPIEADDKSESKAPNGEVTSDTNTPKVDRVLDKRPVPKPRIRKSVQNPVINVPKVVRSEVDDDSLFEYVETYSKCSERPAGPDSEKVVGGKKELVVSTEKVPDSEDTIVKCPVSTVDTPEILSADAVVDESGEGTGDDQIIDDDGTDEEDESEDEDETDDDDEEEVDDVNTGDVSVDSPMPLPIVQTEEKDPPEDPPPLDARDVASGVPVPERAVHKGEDPTEDPPPLRKSTRVKKKPKRFDGFLMTHEETIKKSKAKKESEQLKALLHEQAALTAKVLQTVLK